MFNNASERTKTTMQIVAILALLATATGLFIVPGAMRLPLVSSMGVLSANSLTFFLHLLGWGFIVAAVVTGVFLTRKVIKNQRAKAAQAAVEKSKQYELPSRDETDPVKIKRGLDYVVREIPSVALLVKVSGKQLNEIQQHLKTIQDIFAVNPDLIVNSDKRFDYATFTALLQEVLGDTCRTLVRIIYQARAVINQDTNDSVDELLQDIKDVNRENGARANAAKQLAVATVESSTASSDDSATSLLLKLIDELATTQIQHRKEGLS